MYEHIYGIVPPMTTPFRQDDTIDEDALRVETRYMVEVGKVHGLAVCGSTGEGHTLTTGETRRITEIVVKESKGRIPSITGIIVDSTAQLLLAVTEPAYVTSLDGLWSLLRAGGVFYGGLIGALVAIVVLLRPYDLPLLPTADVLAPSVALGHFFGRLGCFAAGCCYGAPWDPPFCVTYTHPDALAPRQASPHEKKQRGMRRAQVSLPREEEQVDADGNCREDPVRGQCRMAGYPIGSHGRFWPQGSPRNKCRPRKQIQACAVEPERGSLEAEEEPATDCTD